MQVAVQTALHLSLRAGQGAHVDPTFGSLLGRPPRTVAAYVNEQAAGWRSVPARRS